MANNASSLDDSKQGTPWWLCSTAFLAVIFGFSIWWLNAQRARYIAAQVRQVEIQNELKNEATRSVQISRAAASDSAVELNASKRAAALAERPIDLFSPKYTSDRQYATMLSPFMRWRANERYAALLPRLHLSASNEALLIKLLTQRMLASVDLASVFTERGESPSVADRGAATRLVLAEIQNEISDRFGSEIVTAVSTFEQLEPIRAYVTEFESRLGSADLSLTQAQGDALISLLSSEGENNIRFGRQFSERFLQAANSILSPDQMNSLVQLREEKEALKQQRDIRGRFRKKASSE